MTPTEELQIQVDRRVPFQQTEEVTVTFKAANTDQEIRHTLKTEDPDAEVRYEVVRKDRACDVYDNRGAGRKHWTNDYIVLRSTVAGAVVKLRLSV